MKRHWVSYLISGLIAVFVTGCALSTQISPDFTAQNLNALSSNGYVQKAETYYLVFDASSSMSTYHAKWQKLDVAKEIVRRMNATIPNIPITATTRAFGPSLKGDSKNALIYGTTGFDHAAMSAATDHIALPGGVTPLGDAMSAANIDLQGPTERIAMIIISDGEENESDSLALASAEQLKADYGDRLCIYTIHVGDEEDGRALLEKISTIGGCGFSTTAENVLSSDGMANFVQEVFLALDSDGDGVYDENDKCPDTPNGVPVDENGCPYDSDRDGVYDHLDKCPGTPAGVAVDTNGCPFDTDKDGIYDYKDECPGTPEGVAVQANGCPFDADKDGVFNYLDKCPDTPEGVAVYENGCPLDTDKDGVYDYLDKCPDTPEGVTVDENGCPFDTDKDGVYDYKDKCPDTPAGVAVYENGCPLDTDKDGVYDYLDKCPDTPKGVKVDAKGCPFDTDKDGVYDYLDKCPYTPKGVKVDENGCPFDVDKDGVYDYMDKCPDTPAGVIVDENGCPLDTDKDWVYDYKDKCPNTPVGAKVNANDGCWQIDVIYFDQNESFIRSSEYPKLTEVLEVLKKNPDLKIQVKGHTSSLASAKYNMALSEKRSNTVQQYFVGHGIGADRVTQKALGLTQPVAPSDTEKGAALNRRVVITPVR